MQIINPVHLVLGLSGSGKSVLLARSGLRFVSSSSNLHVTEEATFLEVSLQTKLSWENILRGVSKKQIASVILVMDWTTIVEKNNNTQQQVLWQALGELHNTVALRCPYYLLISKMDNLAGFREFFADLSWEDRSQPCGIDLLQQPKAQPSIIHTQLENLLKRLYDRVLFRLHQERNPAKRALLQNFPLQLESFKNKLVPWFEQLINVAAFPLQGIYLTSSVQQGEPVDLLRQVIMQTLPMTVTPTAVAPIKQQSYFTQQLFKKIMARAGVFAHASPAARLKRFITYGVLGLAVVVAGLLLAHGLNSKIADVNAAERAVAAYTTLSQQLAPDEHHDLSQILPALNTLQQAVVSLQHADLPWLVRRQHDVELQAEKAYHQALITYFLPSLGDLLAQPLANTSNPTILYGALKTYLMLGDPSHFDAVFIKSWLTSYWQSTLPNKPELREQLIAHLNALLSQPITPLELNQLSITSARNALAAQSAPIIAYAVLKNHVDNNVVSPIADPQVFAQVFTTDHLTIPALYTAAQFPSVYFQKIAISCKAVVNGDWVLGVGRTQNEQDLRKAVQNLYLQDYANVWETWLTSLKIKPWQNWAEARITLDVLLGRQSPLVTALRTVAANTSLAKLIPDQTLLSVDDKENIQAQLTDKFQNLISVLPGSANAANLNQALQQITRLRDYLSPVAHAQQTQAAFLAVKVRFAQKKLVDPLDDLYLVANNMVPPLHEWLNSLADNSWHLLLEDAAQYLNDRWQAEVWPTYDLRLNNHYPLFANASDDVALDDFVHFFANNGLLDSFVNNYLMPFIDTNKPVWQWRIVDGQTLNLSPTLLIQLERAHIIRSMFFSNGNDIGVGFTLQPQSFEPGVHNFILHLDGQTLSDQPALPVAHHLHWPGATTTPIASFSFTNEQNQQTTAIENGNWALFKLLAKANIQATENPRQFFLTFDLNGNAARYQLIADQVINPFIPHIIDQFRCSNKLTTS